MPLRQRDPATAKAQSAIESAFREIEKAVSPADSKGFENVSLDDVRKTALDIENQLAARQSLRNMRRLEPLFSGLNYYSKAIETLCNGTPYLSWIWAPISIILKISSDYAEAFEQIIKAYSRIAEYLTRFKVLQHSFRQNPAFQQTLAVFYADILEFHKEAYKSVRRSYDLKRHGDQLDHEANAYNIAEAKNMRESLQEWRQESLLKTNQGEKEQNDRQLQAICSWLRANDSDQVVIYDQVSSEASRHPGTCSWIISQAMIASWLGKQSNSPILWLQGNPGCGKSVISTQIINFLGTQSSIIISHFCDSSYASSTQYEEILRSLLFQVVRNSGSMAALIYGQHVGRRAASIAILEQLLQLATAAVTDDLGDNQAVYMIIDGIDDMELDKQKRFLTLLKRISRDNLSRSHSAVCKILVSSRSTQLIRQSLHKKVTVSLSDEKSRLTGAIATYSEQRLKAHRSKFAELCLRDSDLMDIARQIAQKADGMFLWARLVLDYLIHNIFYSSQEVRDAVDTLPRVLAQFYERVLTQLITRFDARSINRLRTIFGWIAFGRRPLQRAEFRSALSYCTGNTSVEELTPSHIFDMCSTLVEERSDSSLWFIHVSVKEYLQTYESVVRLDPNRAYLEHAITTATCISSGLDVFQPDYPAHARSKRMLRGLHAFHLFAYDHWIDCVLHALALGNVERDMTQLISIVSEVSQKLAVSANIRIGQDGDVAGTLSEPRLEFLRPFPPLLSVARAFISARTQKTAGYVDGHVKVTELRDVLDNYQVALRECLALQDYPGFSAEELAQFRLNHRGSGYVCRFSTCSEGFETDEQRIDHEVSHAPLLKCPITTCQYPPFRTKQALKRHEQVCHEHVLIIPKMKTIRRASHITRIDRDLEKPMASFLPGKGTSSNHALQDYQMQLLLKEQQDQKRPMMSRHEQERYPASPPPPNHDDLPGFDFDMFLPMQEAEREEERHSKSPPTHPYLINPALFSQATNPIPAPELERALKESGKAMDEKLEQHIHVSIT
ncbi:hypothetical protein F4808DRAFT_476479 [Astrocystis sublimbata]|nr:hypothetical protein F4808DRAFT_476479 [Astrocystis sublimbata]